MKKIYRINFILYGLAIGGWIAVILVFRLYFIHGSIKYFWIGLGGIPGVICVSLALFLWYKIDDEGIVGGLSFIKREPKKLKYKDIRYIGEASILFIPAVDITPEDRDDLKTSTGLYPFVSHWREILREVILRTNPKAFVDNKSLKYARLKREEIGKLYKEQI